MSASADIQQFLQGLGLARARMETAAEEAVTEYAEQVIGEAARLAPVGGGIYSPRDPSPGRLKDSATVLPLTNVDGVITQVIGFNTVYAARQHEELTWRHDQGQAKFLETAMQLSAAQFVPMIIAAAEAAR